MRRSRCPPTLQARRPRSFWAALASAAALASCTVSADQPDLAGQDIRLTIFHTADIHSRLLPYDIAVNTTDRGLGLFPEAYPFGGAARIRALYLSQLQSTSRSLLLDSGDCFEGAPLFNENNGEPEFRFISLMHPDASAVGNHEYDHGALNFAEQAKMWVNYPLLAANYDFADFRDPTHTMLGEIVHPFTIVNKDGLRVGIIGLGNIDALSTITQGGNALDAIALEQNETVRQYVALLAPMTDLIGIVSHQGLTQDQTLVTGYDDVYPYASAKPFLERADAPWMLMDVLPPRNPSEDDNSCQLNPGEKLNADGSCPTDATVDVSKINPNRRVHVFIPPVQNIDFIMGGHIHVVLDPTASMTELVVQRQPALRIDETPSGSCPSGSGLYTDAADASKTGCYSAGLWPDGSYHRNRDGSDVFGAVPNTDTWDQNPRQVLIQHSGAFAKYLGRLDLVVRMPPKDKPAGLTDQQWTLRQAVGAEIVAHDYLPLPIDALWCLNPRPDRNPYDPNAWQTYVETLAAGRDQCLQEEDPETLELLLPYTEGLNTSLELPRIFAYTPNDILRFSKGTGEENNQTADTSQTGSIGGDSQLGNLISESMRDYQSVNAEFGLTNTLGIRDDIYHGPIYLEAMFNVFPFENTLVVQYLSGHEIQDMLDFVTDVSGSRGCQAQAQVAGLSFVQDCGRVIRNTAPSCDQILPNGDRPEPCVPSCQQTSDCVNAANQYPGSPSASWYAQTCSGDETPSAGPNTGCECVQGRCYAWSAHNIKVNGEDLDLSAQYKGCVNDYIAAGGSGYRVLQFNTSKTFTGVSMRDSLIEYLRDKYCHCDRILAGDPACARLKVPGTDQVQIDPAAVTYCNAATTFESYLNQMASDLHESVDQAIADHPERLAGAPTGVWEGSCECRQALASQQDPDPNCGHVTPQVIEFCKNPTNISVVTAQEDGRIVESTQ